MKKYLLAFLSIPLLLPFIALAQEVVPPVAQQVVNISSPLMQSLNGTQGVTSMAIVAVVVQILMLILQSRFASVTGKYKFIIVYALNALGGIAALKLQGMDTFTALTHSNTMAAYQIMLHQAYKQFIQKDNTERQSGEQLG